MKRILHVIDTTGPGGAETVFIELLSRLQSECCESVVVIRGTGWVYDELKRRGFEPYIIDAKGSFNLGYLFNLIKVIRKEKIDLIQAHLLGSSVYSCVAGFLTGRPVAITLHGVVDFDEERFLAAKFFIVNKLAGRIVLVSKDLLKRLQERVEINESKLSIIYNGVDIESYSQEKNDGLRDELGFDRNDLIVGSVGNVRKAKAYDVLLQAVALVVKEVPNIKFVIVGDKENRLYEELCELRAELALEKSVYFLGFRDDIADFLCGIDLFLLSSISEGCPISVIEAMSSDVPMIVTDCGGLNEMVEADVSAVICEAGSSLALKEALLHLLEDSELKQRLIKNSRKIVESRFTMGAMLGSYCSIYNNLD